MYEYQFDTLIQRYYNNKDDENTFREDSSINLDSLINAKGKVCNLLYSTIDENKFKLLKSSKCKKIHEYYQEHCTIMITKRFNQLQFSDISTNIPIFLDIDIHFRVYDKDYVQLFGYRDVLAKYYQENNFYIYKRNHGQVITNKKMIYMYSTYIKCMSINFESNAKESFILFFTINDPNHIAYDQFIQRLKRYKNSHNTKIIDLTKHIKTTSPIRYETIYTIAQRYFYKTQINEDRVTLFKSIDSNINFIDMIRLQNESGLQNKLKDSSKRIVYESYHNFDVNCTYKDFDVQQLFHFIVSPTEGNLKNDNVGEIISYIRKNIDNNVINKLCLFTISKNEDINKSNQDIICKADILCSSVSAFSSNGILFFKQEDTIDVIEILNDSYVDSFYKKCFPRGNLIYNDNYIYHSNSNIDNIVLIKQSKLHLTDKLIEKFCRINNYKPILDEVKDIQDKDNNLNTKNKSKKKKNKSKKSK